MVSSQSGPIVAVLGGTGNQGGSVIRYLKESSKPYQIRAVVRDTSAQKAKALDVELVQGDVEDKASLEKAFSGAEIVFAVTNFWAHTQKDIEVRQGKSIVDAVKAAKVDLFVWSGLGSPTKDSNGKYTHVDHFDGKASITDYAVQQLGESHVKSVEAASYMSNWGPGGGLKPNPSPAGDGSFVYVNPGPESGKWPLIDIDEYGIWVVAAIEHRDKIPLRFFAAAEELSNTEILTILNKHSGGKKVNYYQPSEEQFNSMLETHAKMPTHVARDFTEMVAHALTFGYYGKEDVFAHHDLLSSKPTSFADWAAKADWSKVYS